MARYKYEIGQTVLGKDVIGVIDKRRPRFRKFLKHNGTHDEIYIGNQYLVGGKWLNEESLVLGGS